MTDYWYIWFEVFENGNKIGSGRWHQAYAYKQNAVRRARQMWSKDLYNPMTGTTISRKWVVSKTNPWEEKEEAMRKFEIGDWVYADDWCYGQIQEIDKDIVYVEFSTRTGGGNLCFELSELRPAPSPDEPKISIRDNLLVTAGARAAYMDCKGDIDIPGGLDGEDKLANFVTTAVDSYIENGDDTPFDEYIESRLAEKWGTVAFIYGRSKRR